VEGYDRYSSTLTDELIREGIQIHFEENINLIPKETDLVVYTPAIPAEHAELVFYKSHNYPVIKRADLLEAVTAKKFTIAVAGTHGKTTTTTMIAHILKSGGQDCTAFLGGISVNYESNFIRGNNHVVVVEADEFDRSFLKLNPQIAVITSCDADHLDVYQSEKEVQRAYDVFASKVKPGGTLVIKENLPVAKNNPGKKYSYQTESMTADFHCENLVLKNGMYVFDFHSPFRDIRGVHMNVPGKHNVENTVAAIAVAQILNIGNEEIIKAIKTFAGVKRRFEFIVRSETHIYIDDYAHHPNEINAFLRSVKEIFPGKNLTCIFQPHLYSRTRDFAREFSESLSIADELLLLPVYPARELPVEGVTSDMLLKNCTTKNKRVVTKEECLGIIEREKPELLVTIGAGDIDQLVPKIKWILENEIHKQ
jgi:UDP-N-acetylmuramate--alanine ligase